MPCIDENSRSRAGGLGEKQRHTPIGDIGVIEGRFEWLVFEEKALIRLEGGVDFVQSFFKEADARANTLRAGVVGAVGKPGAMSREPSAAAIATQSRMWLMARRRMTGSGLPTEPYLYS